MLHCGAFGQVADGKGSTTADPRLCEKGMHWDAIPDVTGFTGYWPVIVAIAVPTLGRLTSPQGSKDPNKTGSL